MRPVSWVWVAATTSMLAALMVLAPAQPGLAHASMVKSTPTNGANLSKAPLEIRAWFSEKLAVKGSVIRLEDSHMKVLASGGVDTKVKTLDVMAVKAPMLSAGTYTVTWLAVSDDDGATEKGSFKFTVGTPQ
ncbi:MAG TPA: copper resistance CopC family protein [bacterium]|nr:copper resistance CopC family protein [bacterium]